MRIRRKKHLKERLNGVSDYLLIADRDIPNVNLAIEDKKYIDFSEVFENDQPLYLEIGCGKAGFILEYAKLYPQINFVAVEMLQNVIVMGAEKAKELGLKNLKFFNCSAEYLARYFKDDTFERIFLNFSPPYPQKGYESRRLTCDRLIGYYKNFLKDGGWVEQKTDDKDFFDYSKEQFEKFGFVVKDQSEELKNNKIFNLRTEYETKFLEQGLSVYRLMATVVKKSF